MSKISRDEFDKWIEEKLKQINMSLAISLLYKYIDHRKKAIKKMEKVKEDPELNADIIWADEAIADYNSQITELQKAIEVLHKAEQP